MKLNEKQVKNIVRNSMIREAVKRVTKRLISEGAEYLCPKLEAMRGRFGKIVPGGEKLPAGVSVSSLTDDDIRKVTKNLKPEHEYYIELEGGNYVLLSPEGPAVSNAKAAAEKEAKRAGRMAFGALKDDGEEMDFHDIPDPVSFPSMSAVQKFVEKKYGRYIEFDYKQTKRGRLWAYAATLSFTSMSYANGPDEVSRDLIEKISKWLRPFGFFYEGCSADRDERKWECFGTHVWRRQGQFGTYDPTRRRHSNWEDEYQHFWDD